MSKLKYKATVREHRHHLGEAAPTNDIRSSIYIERRLEVGLIIEFT